MLCRLVRIVNKRDRTEIRIDKIAKIVTRIIRLFNRMVILVTQSVQNSSEDGHGQDSKDSHQYNLNNFKDYQERDQYYQDNHQESKDSHLDSCDSHQGRKDNQLDSHDSH